MCRMGGESVSCCEIEYNRGQGAEEDRNRDGLCMTR